MQKKKIRKIFDFLSKFSTIISQRNRRLAQFCKKLGLQNFILSRKSRSKTSGTPSGGVEHEIWTFFILRIRKTNRYNSFWFILARGGAHASLRAGKNRWKSRFLIEFSNSWDGLKTGGAWTAIEIQSKLPLETHAFSCKNYIFEPKRSTVLREIEFLY